MAIYQMLVRNLDGNTLCLQFPSGVVRSEAVQEKLAVSEGVPQGLQRLITGTLEFASGKYLEAGPDGFFPSCTLLLRLRGGKGGFGSLLRGAATKAGQKKTNNFDACRDMSGRRLRHVNAEKKLKEWRAEAKERELEKTAEDFMKKRRKTEEEDQGLGKELEKFKKESLEAREDIGSAVTDGLVEAKKVYVDLKRKKVEALEFEAKKSRTWSPEEEDDSEDEDDQVLDEIVEEASTSKHGSEEASTSQQDSEEATPSKVDREEESATKQHSEEATSSKLDREELPAAKLHGEEASSSKLDREKLPAAKQHSKEVSPAKQSEDESTSKQNSESPTSSSQSVDGEALPNHPPLSFREDSKGPLDFENYNTSKHLEVLGLERLKIELQNRGLKCGGSVTERAARLFLLKTIPLEKLDKKLLAKPAPKSMRKT